MRGVETRPPDATVVIVEPDRTVRELIQRVIAQRGYRIVTVAAAREALRLLGPF